MNCQIPLLVLFRASAHIRARAEDLTAQLDQDVTCYDTVQVCLIDGKLSGAKPLERFVGPDTIVIARSRDLAEPNITRNGDLIHLDAEYKARLGWAVLLTYIRRFEQTRFIREIYDGATGLHLGFIYVERPDPDPDSRFKILTNDPMLAAIPPSLRSKLDPAALVPSATQPCETDKYIAIVPVGI